MPGPPPSGVTGSPAPPDRKGRRPEMGIAWMHDVSLATPGARGRKRADRLSPDRDAGRHDRQVRPSQGHSCVRRRARRAASPGTMQAAVPCERLNAPPILEDRERLNGAGPVAGRATPRAWAGQAGTAGSPGRVTCGWCGGGAAASWFGCHPIDAATGRGHQTTVLSYSSTRSGRGFGVTFRRHRPSLITP